VTGLVRSPTFTLVEAYRLGALTCVHVDLYRLQGAVQVDELGLRDFLSAGCLLLVEWAEKGGDALPMADMLVTFTYADSGRLCSLRARSPLGREWLKNLRHDTSLASYVSNLT
jgi:tRNA threonylcarbamoyladenosine biosynthesis protein TsaE